MAKDVPPELVAWHMKAWAAPRVTLKTTESTNKLPPIRRNRNRGRRRVSSEHQLKLEIYCAGEGNYLRFNYTQCVKLVRLEEHVWASETMGEPRR